jgi:hypothetical protein
MEGAPNFCATFFHGKICFYMYVWQIHFGWFFFTNSSGRPELDVLSKLSPGHRQCGQIGRNFAIWAIFFGVRRIFWKNCPNDLNDRPKFTLIISSFGLLLS